MNTFATTIFNTLCKNRGIIFFTFSCFYFVNSPLNAATLKVDNGFESGDLGSFRCSGNCPTVSTSHKKSGNYSGKFSLTKQMKTSYRTEVTLSKKHVFQFGKEYWMSLDYRYEDWKKDFSQEASPFQIHTTPSTYTKGCPIENSAILFPFWITSGGVKDEVVFNTHKGRVLWKGPLERKKWLNMVVHFKISPNNDGFVEAWKDGVKIGRVDGPNSYKKDYCGNIRPPYLQMGIYKYDWRSKNSHRRSDSTRRELWIDNFKLAEGSNGYSLVSSSLAPAPKPIAVKAPAPKPISIPALKLKQDIIPPVISNVQASVTGTSATITWNTNEASSSSVKYGLSGHYNLNTNNNLLVTSHKTTLKNLVAGKLYHYAIYAKDGRGNSRVSSDLTFTVNPISHITKQGLVAHWPMATGTGATIADNSGNGYTGKLINGAHLIAGEGVKFDGVNDYFDAGKLNVGGNAMTLSAWVWSDDLSNCRARDCRIISKAIGGAEQNHYFMVSTIKVGSKTRLRFRLKTNGKTSTLIAASGNIVKNEWIHVTASYDGKTMRLYKDGVEVGSKAKQGNMTTNSKSSVWIGGNPPSATSRPWKGHIGDVRIYSHAMTGVEISKLANSENPLEMDKVAPKISHVQVAVTDMTATISWNTNEASDSRVKYGLTSRYGSNISNDLLVTNHKVTLKNLEAGKQYHYQISSKDNNKNIGSTKNLVFTTESATDEGLVAHWLMETRTGSTIADSSGNGYVGKLMNGARLMTGEGIKFDGVNDYLNVGNLNIAGKSISLSAWFWSDNLSNCRARDCRIISKATGGAEQNHYFMVSTIKVGSKTRLRFRLKTNGKTSTLIAASGDIVKNQWVHVAAIYDGQTMRLYKDGIEVGSKAKQGSITTNSKSPVWIGGNPSSATSRPWKGHIGDVRIYSYPLTNTEILKLSGE